MNAETPLNNNQDTYDNVEEDEENDIEEQQSNQSHMHQNEEEETVEDEVEEEEEEGEQVESEETYVQPNQSDKKDQSPAPQYTNSPPQYPHPYQYSPFMNPNMPQYPMQHPGGPMQHPGFNPYNYYAAPPPPPPTNLQENNAVTEKPVKKKPTKNSSNKPTVSTEKPSIENDSIVHVKPNRKEKPTTSPNKNPNHVYVSGPTYTNTVNPFLGQNQNMPINPINSFNTHPFNNQFSIPFYPHNDAPFPNNYMNPSNGFNGANNFPSQFGQTNSPNPYVNNPYASKQYSATPYQNNPNFNVQKTLNSPFGFQSLNPFDQKFNGYAQYFANPSSNSK